MYVLFGAGTREQMFACPALLLLISHRCVSSVEHRLLRMKGEFQNLWCSHKFIYGLSQIHNALFIVAKRALSAAAWFVLRCNSLYRPCPWRYRNNGNCIAGQCRSSVELDVKRLPPTLLAVVPCMCSSAREHGNKCLRVPRCSCVFPIVALAAWSACINEGSV